MIWISSSILNSVINFGTLGHNAIFAHRISEAARLGLVNTNTIQWLLKKLERNVGSNFDGAEVPNTSGNWFYIVPGINGKLSDRFTARLSGQLPVYRNLSGTQLTTTYTASLGIIYNINLLD